jgi:hypothetical protein
MIVAGILIFVTMNSVGITPSTTSTETFPPTPHQENTASDDHFSEETNETEEDRPLLPMIVSGILIVILVVVIMYVTLKEQERQKQERKEKRQKERREEWEQEQIEKRELKRKEMEDKESRTKNEIDHAGEHVEEPGGKQRGEDVPEGMEKEIPLTDHN